MFPGALGVSLAGRGLEDDVWSLDAINIREYATDKHRSVDATPFGGGPGMVLRPDVINAAIEGTVAKSPDLPLIYMSPRGKPLTQKRAHQLATGPGLTVLCGRFEGLDQRVLDSHPIEEISLGDFVLSGGEPAALGESNHAVGPSYRPLGPSRLSCEPTASVSTPVRNRLRNRLRRECTPL